jgi:hypothetical protein
MCAASGVMATDRVDAAEAGFYGGISLRDRAADGPGLVINSASPVWNRFATPTTDDTAQRALLFGGYRWRNDLALEAALSSMDKYALRPADSLGGQRGVGLDLAHGAGGFDESPQMRTLNVDVFTSWNFYKSLALYGRLGYAQNETAATLATAPAAIPDARRPRDGVNYGIGMRYEMNSALGLKVEYGRFGRFAGEAGPSLMPESDQVSVGVQLRF